MHPIKIPLVLLACGLMAAPLGHAESLTHVVGVSLVLVGSCENRSVADATAVNFDPSMPGSNAPRVTSAPLPVAGSGTDAVNIRCSDGSVPAVNLIDGSHDGKARGGTRAMVNSAGDFIAYELYTDAGHTTLLPTDGVIDLIPAAGVSHSVRLYGKTVDRGALPADSYTDTVTVQLTF